MFEISSNDFEVQITENIIYFFLIAQFLRDKPSLTETSLAREALWDKIKDLKSQYGVLAWANKKETFLFIDGKIEKGV